MEWTAPESTHDKIRAMFRELEDHNGRVMNYLQGIADVLEAPPNSQFKLDTMTFVAPLEPTPIKQGPKQPAKLVE